MDPMTLQKRVLEELVSTEDAEGHTGMLSAEALAQHLGVNVKKVKNAIYTLARRGLVDTEFGCGIAILTQTGYAAAEEAIRANAQSRNTVIINGPVIGSAIAVGDSQATVSNVDNSQRNDSDD